MALIVKVHVSQGWSWFNVVAPTLAALAAGASWRSVFLTRRAQRDADRPQLSFYLTGDSTPLTMEIQNLGRGVAVHPGFAVLSGLDTGFAVKVMYDGNLQTYEKVRYEVPFLTTDAALGIAFAEDRYQYVHIRDMRGETRSIHKSRLRFRRNKRKPVTLETMFRKLYGKDGERRCENAKWLSTKLIKDDA